MWGKDFHLAKKIVTAKLELTVQTNMMWNIVANDRSLYRFVKGRNANPTSKEETATEQETFTVSQNEPYESVLYKDDIEQLIKFHLKTQLEGLTLLAYILSRTCISCKEKEEFIDYLIK